MKLHGLKMAWGNSDHIYFSFCSSIYVLKQLVLLLKSVFMLVQTSAYRGGIDGLDVMQFAFDAIFLPVIHFEGRGNGE